MIELAAALDYTQEMDETMDILARVREAATRKVLFLPHALRQMLRPDRMLSCKEIRGVITEGELVEDYPDDARGQSCLLLGRGQENRPIHVVCSPKADYLAIITTYIPDEEEWPSDFTTRTKR